MVRCVLSQLKSSELYILSCEKRPRPSASTHNNFFFAGCHRNQIVTWRFKCFTSSFIQLSATGGLTVRPGGARWCFKTSHKQFFTLVSIGVKGLYED